LLARSLLFSARLSNPKAAAHVAVRPSVLDYDNNNNNVIIILNVEGIHASVAQKNNFQSIL